MNPTDRPYIILNAAMTVDGKIDTVARRGAAISSPQDAERVDRLRAASDAVMVGGNTLLGDDPRLTVKSAALRAERQMRGLAENPVKVGVVTRANLKLDSRFLTVGPAPIKLFTCPPEEPVDQLMSQLNPHNLDMDCLSLYLRVPDMQRYDLKKAKDAKIIAKLWEIHSIKWGGLRDARAEFLL